MRLKLLVLREINLVWMVKELPIRSIFNFSEKLNKILEIHFFFHPNKFNNKITNSLNIHTF